MSIIRGRAFYCGDYVNTDVIAPGRFEPYSGPEHLASMALVDYESPVPFVRPQEKKSDFSILVCGTEFGCGSSRETAPQALHYAGARVVIAKSFARIFYRNCINMGLLLAIEGPHHFGPEVMGTTFVIDTEKRSISSDFGEMSFPDFGPVADIIAAGGLTAFNKKKMEIAR